jgi:hypothetical protein
MTELLQVLADVPPMLTTAWVVWFGAGVLLMVWYRKATTSNFELQHAAASRTVARTKSGPRPSAGVRPHPAMPAAPAPRPAAEPAPKPDLSALDAAVPVIAAAPVVAVAKPKPAPLVVGDPFGDLATLLDQAAARVETPSYRKPGDSPILNSAGSPILRDDEHKY